MSLSWKKRASICCECIYTVWWSLVPEKAGEWESKRRRAHGRHGEEGSRSRGLGDRLPDLTGYLDTLPTLRLGNNDLMRQVRGGTIKCDQRWKVWWKKAKTWRSKQTIATRSFLLPSVWVISCRCALPCVHIFWQWRMVRPPIGCDKSSGLSYCYSLFLF